MCEYRRVPQFDIGDGVVITSGEEEAIGTVLGRQYGAEGQAGWWYEVYDEDNDEVAVIDERYLRPRKYPDSYYFVCTMD